MAWPLILFFLCLVVPDLWGSEKEPAIVLKIRGDVQIFIPGKGRQSGIRKGDLIPMGSKIRTSSKSFVILKLFDGSRLTVAPKTHADVKLDKQKVPLVHLLQGQIRAKVQKDYQKKEKFYVRTRGMSMGVRGTDFVVRMDDRSGPSLFVKEGVVLVHGQNLEVKSGTGFLKGKKFAFQKTDLGELLWSEPVEHHDPIPLEPNPSVKMDRAMRNALGARKNQNKNHQTLMGD